MPGPKKTKTAFDRIVKELEKVTMEVKNRENELAELVLLKSKLEQVLEDDGHKAPEHKRAA